MLRRHVQLAALGLVLLLPAPASATPPSDTTPCSQLETRGAVRSFVAHFNHGAAAKLDRLFAPEPYYQWYSSPRPGERLRRASHRRDTLIPYFRARHAADDELRLMAFHWSGKATHWSNFWFEMLRSVPAYKDGRWFGTTGKGAAICDSGSPQLIVVSLGGEQPDES